MPPDRDGNAAPGVYVGQRVSVGRIVLVGVNVIVGVSVTVGVSVIVGVSVTVGVNVGVDVAGTVFVSEGASVSVGVRVGESSAATPVPIQQNKMIPIIPPPRIYVRLRVSGFAVPCTHQRLMRENNAPMILHSHANGAMRIFSSKRGTLARQQPAFEGVFVVCEIPVPGIRVVRLVPFGPIVVEKIPMREVRLGPDLFKFNRRPLPSRMERRIRKGMISP